MGSLIRSTGIVSLSTLASRVLGFVRDIVMALAFGATGSTDAFFLAFRIPNLLRRFVSEGALTIAFIPVYTGCLVREGEEAALDLAQRTLMLLLLTTTLLTALCEFFAPEIVRALAWGFSRPEKIALAITLTRIMFPYLFLISIVAFAMGILNSRSSFFAPAFSPVLLNVGMLAGIVGISRLFEEPYYGVAIGVLVGGALQLLLQLPFLARSGFRFRATFDFRHPGLKKIALLFLPMAFPAASYQVNLLIGTALASSLPEGSITYLYYSDRLTEVVLGVFVMSIGTVILPELSRRVSRDERDGLGRLYGVSLRAALMLAIPACAAFMAVGMPIVRLFFAHGEFTDADAAKTFRALLFASPGIPAIAALRITYPVFYAIGDVASPLIAALLGTAGYAAFGYALMHTGLGHAGLTLANSIVLVAQAAVLYRAVGRRIGGLDHAATAAGIGRMLAATAAMVAVIMPVALLVDWTADDLLKRAACLLLVVVLGMAAYGAACHLFGVDEMRGLLRKIGGVLRRMRPGVTDGREG